MITEKQIVYEDAECVYWVREDKSKYTVLRNMTTYAVELGSYPRTQVGLEKAIKLCGKLKNWKP